MESLRRLVEGCAYNTTEADALCDPAASAAINTCNAQGVHLEPNLGVSAAALMSNGFRNPVPLLPCPHLTRATGPKPGPTDGARRAPERPCMHVKLSWFLSRSFCGSFRGVSIRHGMRIGLLASMECPNNL